MLVVLTTIFWGCLPADESPRLQVVEISPDPAVAIPAGSPIRVRFDRYLNPARLGSIDLVSGDLPFSIGRGYDPVDKSIVILPDFNLRAALGYRLTIAADGLEGLDGSTLDEDLTIDFLVAPGPEPVRRPRVEFADVAPIFAQRCGCHGPDVYPALTEDALVDGESKRQPGLLVEPGEPMRSQLVLRLLPDYPGIRGAQMPLEGELPDDELRQIISWVEGLR